jgi:predicted nicotinamide N-methyase
MSRRTLIEYRETQPAPRQSAFTKRKQAAANLTGRIRAKLREQGLKGVPPYWEWHWEAMVTGGTVIAQNRSEARARIKTVLGVKPNRRLPVGTTIKQGNKLQ